MTTPEKCKCPKCGGTNTTKSDFLDLWSCNDCPDPNTWTDWQQSLIASQKLEIERLQKLLRQNSETHKAEWAAGEAEIERLNKEPAMIYKRCRPDKDQPCWCGSQHCCGYGW